MAKHIYNPTTCEGINKTRGWSVWSQPGLHDDLVNPSYMLRLSQINNPRTIDKVSISLIFVCSLLWLIFIVNLKGFRLALETCLWVCLWGSLKTHTLDVDNVTPWARLLVGLNKRKEVSWVLEFILFSSSWLWMHCEELTPASVATERASCVVLSSHGLCPFTQRPQIKQ